MQPTGKSSNAIARFWQMFELRQAELAATDSADSPVYDALLAQLQRIDPGIYFEFSSEPGACELIVSADGDQALFPLVHQIVAQSPAISGWTIRALKPKLGWPETASWEDLEVSIAAVVFEPLEREESNDLGLRIYVPGISENEVEESHNAILRALDAALGEEGFAQSVAYTEVLPLPHDADPGSFIPLVELEDFIEQRGRTKLR